MQWRMYCCECAEGSVPISCGVPPRPRTSAASLVCADIGHRPRRWWGGEDEDTLANSNLLASDVSTPSIHNIQYNIHTFKYIYIYRFTIYTTGRTCYRVMFSISPSPSIKRMWNPETRYLFTFREMKSKLECAEIWDYEERNGIIYPLDIVFSF